MRRASHLALATLLALTASPLASVGASATPAPAPRFPTLPEDKAKAEAPLDASGRYVVTFKAGKDADQATGRAKRMGVAADKTFRNVVKGFAAKLDASQVAELRLDPDVEAVVPDEIFKITA